LTKVDTVDAYQGKQNRIVVLSLVRNNPERNMGHVRSKNRINVALSRAMDRLVIIGSAKMFDVGNNPLYQVLQRMRAGHRVRPASDLQVM
jgi:superfamily I DNA and/or RNA helicase